MTGLLRSLQFQRLSVVSFIFSTDSLYQALRTLIFYGSALLQFAVAMGRFITANVFGSATLNFTAFGTFYVGEIQHFLTLLGNVTLAFTEGFSRMLQAARFGSAPLTFLPNGFSLFGRIFTFLGSAAINLTTALTRTITFLMQRSAQLLLLPNATAIVYSLYTYLYIFGQGALNFLSYGLGTGFPAIAEELLTVDDAVGLAVVAFVLAVAALGSAIVLRRHED